jgi:hypothetical protein
MLVPKAAATRVGRVAHPHRRRLSPALWSEFAGAFSQVVFAITDWSAERRFLGPFRDVFEAGSPF